MEARSGTKKVHMGRRRLVMLAISGGIIVVGLFVLADQALVAGLLQPFLGTQQASTSAGLSLTPYGNISYIAYIVGFGILMTGVGIARSTMRSSLSSYASGGSSMGMGGFNPESMQKMMETSMAQMNTMGSRSAPAAAPATVVKIKCSKCGSLEEQDAAFCHKCGSAI